MGDLGEYNVSMFKDIKHMDENGIEFWYARELMTILEYTLCSEGRFKHLSFFVKILKYFIKRC